MNSYSARSKNPLHMIAVGAVILTGLAGGHALAADVHSAQVPVESLCAGVSSSDEMPYDQGSPVMDDCAAAAVQAATPGARGWPDFALTANGRSIQMIESKEAPVEFAQPRQGPF